MVLSCVVAWLLFSQVDGANASPPTEAKAEAAQGAEVKLHDTVVFRVLRAQGGKTATERARVAARVLDQAVQTSDAAHVVVRGERHLVQVGDAIVIELDLEDAAAASDSSLQACSSRVRGQVRSALEAERKRSGMAHVAFAISIVVFSALMSLFALRKIGELGARARTFVEENPERIGAVRLQSLEVIGAGPLRAAMLVASFALRLALQAAVLYVWLVVSLSQFGATLPYTHKLNEFLFEPLFSLMGRLLSALPLGLLALVSGVVVYVLQRFVQLFFENVRRGHTPLPWLSQDLVAPVSALSRVSVVLLSFVFVGPLITGDPNGSLAHAGMIVMVMLALASTPLLASAVVGVMQVLSRRVRVGQELWLSGRRGTVTEVGLFDLRLTDDAGHEVRVPHLLSLISPLDVRRANARMCVELVVSAAVRPASAASVLLAAAGAQGQGASVELRDIDAGGARFAVSLNADSGVSESELRMALAEALAEAGLALGSRGAAVAGARAS